jgi:recombination protein RecA
MKAAFSKAELQAEIATRFGDAFRIHEKTVVETLSTGVAEIDALTGGLPRGAISELFGPASSGRTSLMYSLLTYATRHEETCALIDLHDVFAPAAAVSAGMNFDRLLWVRCAGNLEHAFKAADLLLHAGGFGLVVLDLGDVPGKEARQIISSWWYRFRRTVEDRPTVLTVISEEACTRSCAALALELNGAAEWSRVSLKRGIGSLLRSNAIKVDRQRPISPWMNQSQFIAAGLAV